MTDDAAPRAVVSIRGRGVVAERLRRVLGPGLLTGGTVPCEVTVLAHGGPHAEVAAELLERGGHVVSTSGGLHDVRELLGLEDLARSHGATLVLGAAVSPGLSGLLARWLVTRMAACDELHVAVHGTAGPACAHEHHAQLSGWAVGWTEDGWIDRLPAGSGRELCWFPEPVGARDCYRGELPDPVLLHRSFPEVDRIVAKVSATRRDRLTARLPMLSPPHQEGGVGALRVEARGADAQGARMTLVVGVAELVGTAAAAVAAAFVDLARAGQLPPGVVTSSDPGLDHRELLRSIASRGVRLQAFTGIPEP